MKISVIVPTFRHWPLLQNCLDALVAQTVASSEFEIIVVNNDPSDLSPQSLRMPSNARIIVEAEPGSYAARNRGIDEARAKYLAFTDADCEPQPGWLAAILRCIAQNDTEVRIGGDIVVTAPRNCDIWKLHEKLFGFNQARYVRRGGWAATANMTAPRAAFQTVGRFDQSLYSGGDHEWGKRAADHGLPIIFCPEAVVEHPAREGPALLARTRRIAGGATLLDIQQAGLATTRLRFVLGLPGRLCLPIAQLRRILGSPGISLGKRFELLLLCYHLRFVAMSARFRLLYLRSTPERR
jgi:glycosyltransferase involved in cell wall biosynthesis